MHGALYTDILRAEGFQRIGELNHRLQLSVWWNPAPEKLLQVVLLRLGDCAILKGDKSYFLKSVSSEGETWARDIGPLHDYLEGHFPEVRISFSHFREVPAHLAGKAVRQRLAADAPTQSYPTVEQIGQLQRQLEIKSKDVRSMNALRSVLKSPSDLLTGYIHNELRTKAAELEQLQQQAEQQRERFGLLQHLQREYQHKGSAAVYTFSISSNIQVVESSGFADALRAVVKELTDMHRYQVAQKLGGGRLKIQVAEVKEPAITWIEQWLGGALTPTQLQRLSPQYQLLRDTAEDHVFVTPDEPISVDGRIRHGEKHVGARFLSDALQRLDKTDTATQTASLTPESVPADTMPFWFGLRSDEAGRMLGAVALPLTQLGHMYVSGTTGSGKSFFARVLIEEAAQHKQLSILVLDPRNQSIGLLAAEDRQKILEEYEGFGMKRERARGFDFRYYAPGLPYAESLPKELSRLAYGRSIVSFKGQGDTERCSLASTILNTAFEACNAQESESPRLVIVVDEAQLFTRKRLDECAKEAAAQAERALDRIAREGRKFGIVLALVSQTMKDFGYELASIRQMTTTKIFLRNSDREIEYASDIIGDGRLLVQLPTGTALVHNANWGVLRIRVRPSYSKVFELGEAEVRRLVERDQETSKTLTTGAQRLFMIIKEHSSHPNQPLNFSRAAELAGITSKRKLLEWTGELERAGVIRTRKLLERGQPRVIELTHRPLTD